MVIVIPEEDRKMRSRVDIQKKYLGKWVFITNVRFTEYMELIEGIVILTADEAYEDIESGIYEEFRDKSKYGTVFGHDLITYPAMNFGRFNT